MEIIDAYVNLANQFQKTIKALSPTAALSLSTGESTLVVLAKGQRAVPDQAGLDTVLKALETIAPEHAQLVAAIAAKAIKSLTPTELEAAAAGSCSLKFARKGGKVTYPVNIAEVAREASEQASEDEIIKFLDADDRLKPGELRKIGTELGITFPAAVKQRDAMIAHIARSLVAL
jgi:hypothetical protein